MTAHAQSIPVSWRHELQNTNQLIDAYDQQSALNVLNVLEHKLDSAQLTETKFGIEVLAQKARTLIFFEKHEEAMSYISRCLELSEQYNMPVVQVYCYISLGFQAERVGRIDECNTYLLKAENIIRRHNLDSMYAYWGNRRASYYRVMGQRDSAFYYAGISAKYGQQYHVESEEALGYTLQGNITRDKNPELAIPLYHRSIATWAKNKNYHGWSASLIGLSRIYVNSKDYKTALSYADSATHIITKMRKGVDLGWVWEDKARIYFLLQKYDSAYLSELEAKKINEEYSKTYNQNKIAEVDAKYRNNLQQHEIAAGKRSRNKLLAGLGILLSLSVMLVLLFVRSLKAQKEIKRKSAELSESLAQKQILISEIHHRVKNNLQLIIGMIELEASTIPHSEVKDHAKIIADRIYSIAAVHNLIYNPSHREGAGFETYIHELLEHICVSSGKPDLRLQIHAKEQYLNLDTLVPLGVILNELISNTVKHGGLAAEQLLIEIKLSESGSDKLLLHYRDNGLGFQTEQPNKTGGFGLKILRTMTAQLFGELRNYNANGANTEIIFQPKNPGGAKGKNFNS